MRTGKSGCAILVLLVMCLSAGGVFAAAEVHSDRRVTFRLKAPKASSVSVEVQFAQGPQAMTKGQDGVWSVTLGPAEPDIYEYSFVVDGLQVSDPANSWLKFWGGAAKNLVEVPGEKPMFFEQQDVPHGTVHTYTSTARNRSA